VLGEQGLVEPGHGLRPGEICPGNKAAQAPPAGVVAGEKDEVRPTLRFADPAVILLHRIAVARQASAVGSRPSRHALDRPAIEGRLVSEARSPRPGRRAPGRDDDAGGIRGRRVEQLDLDADDGMESHGPRCGREPDSTVEALVIRDCEPGQAELNGTLDQLVGRRRPVEEREVRVAMQLGERHRNDV
jgi:hypothetical protein